MDVKVHCLNREPEVEFKYPSFTIKVWGDFGGFLEIRSSYLILSKFRDKLDEALKQWETENEKKVREG